MVRRRRCPHSFHSNHFLLFLLPRHFLKEERCCIATAAAVSVTTDVGCPTQVLDLTRSANQLPPYHPADKNYVFSTSTHSYTRNADPNASANHGIFLKQKLSNLPSSAKKRFCDHRRFFLGSLRRLIIYG